MTDPSIYQSPLSQRYSSKAMQQLWSAEFKFTTWRKLWLALAEAEHELGLNISEAQLQQMRQRIEPLNLETAGAYERKLRHDVMAHIHAWSEQVPGAAGIIHWGATSQFVNCNTELLQIRSALRLIAQKLAAVIDALARFAETHRDLPTLAFTHYQPAQPTTVGRRAAQWAYELALLLDETETRHDRLMLRGAKGTTGTQASYLQLFATDNDDATAHAKVQQLDRRIAEKLDWPADRILAATTQTYPRWIDGLVISTLSAVAAALQKMSGDLRLLISRRELDEPFGEKQVGSSAMPYKRNPMRCERMAGLCRYVIGLTQIPFTTAAEQWLERTLDDSSTRRLALPEPFLALDGALDLAQNVVRGLVVYPKVIAGYLEAELPFMASETILMAAVQNGADRQQAHEAIRQHAIEAGHRIKAEGADNDLLERLAGDAMFKDLDLASLLDPKRFIGRAPQQVDQILEKCVQPIRARYARHLNESSEPQI